VRRPLLRTERSLPAGSCCLTRRLGSRDTVSPSPVDQGGAMSSRFRCRLGKHTWRSRGRGDVLTYVCLVCGKTRDTPPPRRSGGSQAPMPPGGRRTPLGLTDLRDGARPSGATTASSRSDSGVSGPGGVPLGMESSSRAGTRSLP